MLYMSDDPELLHKWIGRWKDLGDFQVSAT